MHSDYDLSHASVVKRKFLNFIQYCSACSENQCSMHSSFYYQTKIKITTTTTKTLSLLKKCNKMFIHLNVEQSFMCHPKCSSKKNRRSYCIVFRNTFIIYAHKIFTSEINLSFIHRSKNARYPPKSHFFQITCLSFEFYWI